MRTTFAARARARFLMCLRYVWFSFIFSLCLPLNTYAVVCSSSSLASRTIKISRTSMFQRFLSFFAGYGEMEQTASRCFFPTCTINLSQTRRSYPRWNGMGGERKREASETSHWRAKCAHKHVRWRSKEQWGMIENDEIIRSS